MTEVAINKCFGGFGISTKAMMLLIKMKAKCIEKIKIKDYYGGRKDNDWKVKYKRDFENHKKLGNGFYVFDVCDVVTDKEFIYNFDGWYNHKLRTDTDLIKVIKKLGKKANGRHANLIIVKIPKGKKWTIENYDGIETVEEAHKTFG